MLFALVTKKLMVELFCVAVGVTPLPLPPQATSATCVMITIGPALPACTSESW